MALPAPDAEAVAAGDVDLEASMALRASLRTMSTAPRRIRERQVERDTVLREAGEACARFQRAVQAAVPIVDQVRKVRLVLDEVARGGGEEEAEALVRMEREVEVLEQEFDVQVREHAGEECFSNYFAAIARILQVYTLGAAVIFFVAVFVGFLMQEFLVILVCTSLSSELQDPRVNCSHVIFEGVLLVPVFAVLFALLCSEMLMLTKGLFSPTSFASCRSFMFVAVMRKLPEPSDNDLSTPYWVDLKRRVQLLDRWFTWGFPLCTVAFGLASMAYAVAACGLDLPLNMPSAVTSLGVLSYSFFLGACVWATITLIAFILSRVKVALGSRHAREFVKIVHRAVRIYEIKPGQMRSKLRMIIMAWCRRVTQGESFAAGDAYPPAGDEYPPPEVTWLAAAMWGVLYLSVSLAMQGKSFGPVILSVMIVITIWVLAYLVRMHMRKTDGCWIVNLVFMSFACLLLSVGSGHLKQDAYAYPFPVSPGDAWTFVNGNRGEWQPQLAPPYPVCSMSWGAKGQLGVIDLAILAHYAYAVDAENIKASLQTTFGFLEQLDGTTVELVHVPKVQETGRVVVTRFRSNLPGGKDTIVLAVKGSSTLEDFYTDASFWAMVVVFQITNRFLPLLDDLPNPLFTRLISRLSPDHMGVDMDTEVLSRSYRTIMDLRADGRNASFVIVGHSLGGGIALVSGANWSIPAVAFSGPGAHFMRARFGITMERAFHNAINIMPMKDIVPTIDRHDEMVQRIECLRDDGSERFGSTVKCHNMLITICELWRSCGDRHNRTFSGMCHNKTRMGHPTSRPILTNTSRFGKYIERAGSIWA